jgi:hypothetical protein
MLVTTDPDVSLQLPRGWRSVPIAESRRIVVAMMAAMPDPSLKLAWDWQLAELDSGAVRATGRGTSSPSCASASILLDIQPKANSVDDAVAAWQAHFAIIGSSHIVVATERVNLAIGPAVRRTMTANPPGGIPSSSTEYVVLLPDHRVAILLGVSPATDTDFPALVDAAARSMAGG